LEIKVNNFPKEPELFQTFTLRKIGVLLGKKKPLLMSSEQESKEIDSPLEMILLCYKKANNINLFQRK